MATIGRFQDIEAWQKARELTQAIYAISGKGRFARDFGLRDQMRRAAVSVMSNIAEGFERTGSTEFIQFLAVAKGSLGELESQLYVALDQGYVSQAEFDETQRKVEVTRKLLGGFIRYLKQSRLRGAKYQRDSEESGRACGRTRSR